MAYKMRLKTYMNNENEKNNLNPYQKDFDKKNLAHEMRGMYFKPVDIGVDGLNDNEPYFYIEYEEIQDEDLARYMKVAKKKIRILKAVINEVEHQDMKIKKIVPLFNLDQGELTEILTGEWRDETFRYLSKDKERFRKDGEDYIQDIKETFNYLVEVDYWKENRIRTDNFVLKEIEDMSFLLDELKEKN